MSIDEEKFESFVFIEALKNAINFNGKANPKALIGKCMPLFPEMKNDMAHYTNLINNITSQVNEINYEKQNKKLLELEPDFFKKSKEKPEKKEKELLPKLEDTDKPIIVRIEPAPSGHLHLGHLFSIVANYEIKKKFNGKFILRIADTNPDNIDIKNYAYLIDDIKWVCDNDIDEVVYQSDRLQIYYKYLRDLIETCNAFVCYCDSEVFKSYIDSKQPCPHRELPHEEQIEHFNKFMNGEIKEKEAVVRFKSDIENKNPAMRAFSLARINENNHARVNKKYRVWPTMHLAVSIDDAVMGITHVIRGKDHEINMERQKMVHKALGFKSPHYFHTGRMKFEDAELSKSKLTELINDGKYDGWDDPRVPSIASYRKRGYKAEAFRKFIISLGISKRDSKITMEEYNKGLDYFNKQILEKISERYFFVHNPKTLRILNIEDYPDKEIEIAKHPDDKSKGYRKISIEKQVFIDSIDFDNLNEGDIFRMMYFGNFKVLEKQENVIMVEFVSKEYDKKLNIIRNIHFVPNENEKVTIIMQNNQRLVGITEPISKLKLNSSIQFERFGFVKYDRIENDSKLFYFSHR